MQFLLLMNRPSNILIQCLPRLSPYVAGEIKDLGFKVLEEKKFSVATRGTLDDCMLLNLKLRTGNRVLWEIASFKSENADELYYNAGKIPWIKYFNEKSYFSIDSFVKNKNIKDNRFANLKLKDAIADYFTKKFGKRPDSGNRKDQVVIYIFWFDNNCKIYFDTSGETLAKHGYRKVSVKAPLAEPLTASILNASRWDLKTHFINPMCGSGTLAIEAALMAMNKPPGLLRDNFGFMHLKHFNRQSWTNLVGKTKDNISGDPDFRIIACDKDKKAINASRVNSQIAGVDHLISFEHCDFEDITIPEGSGTIILNPEYGERLGDNEALEPTYRAIGDFFKNKCKGYWGYIFTGNPNLSKKVGLKASRRIEFFNGKIDCRLLEYEIYGGSRR